MSCRLGQLQISMGYCSYSQLLYTEFESGHILTLQTTYRHHAKIIAWLTFFSNWDFCRIQLLNISGTVCWKVAYVTVRCVLWYAEMYSCLSQEESYAILNSEIGHFLVELRNFTNFQDGRTWVESKEKAHYTWNSFHDRGRRFLW